MSNPTQIAKPRPRPVSVPIIKVAGDWHDDEEDEEDDDREIGVNFALQQPKRAPAPVQRAPPRVET